jgi:hypothetical protein
MTSEHPTATRPRITHQFLQVVRLDNDSRFVRIVVPLMLAIGILYSGVQLLAGDWIASSVSAFSVALLLLLVAFKPAETLILRREFDRSHAFYIGLFWVLSLISIWLLRQLAMLPTQGKGSEPYYMFLLLLIAVLFRIGLSLFALLPTGNDLFISKLPVWEQILVAFNEFIAASMLAFFAGSKLAQLLQPQIITLYVEPIYTLVLLNMLFIYYTMTQLMWLRPINEFLSRNSVWVRLARLLVPLAMLVATWIIVRNFTRLSDPRSANLVGTANVSETILALSPVIWLLIFFILVLVYTGRSGLRQRFLPDKLLLSVPERLRNILSTVSDMDILLLAGVFMTFIPLHAFLFDDETIGIIDQLRLQIEAQNAIIDSSEQALAVLFAFPFYILAVLLLAMYGYVLSNPTLPATERDDLVDRLPIGQLIILIITLYLSAIPFSQVLSQGRLPQLPQELGRVLAFDVLIPLILLYAHYFILIRIPYGRGQARWRKERGARLESELQRIDREIDKVHNKLRSSESLWAMRRLQRGNEGEKIEMLYQFIELNSERDHLNMERLRIVSERQELAEINEAPVSLTVARLPARIVSIGIPLLLAFKIYEWAVVNNGLREIANNPNIGVVEFFQIILRQAQF